MLSASPPTRSPSRRTKPTPTRLALTPKSISSFSSSLSIPAISFSDLAIDSEVDTEDERLLTKKTSSAKDLNGVGMDGVIYKEEDLQHLSELGSGSSGTVSKVLHVPTGKVLARK
ncbi:hypothetical protein HDV00_008258, partial [Rhizophlyctis rosea]